MSQFGFHNDGFSLVISHANKVEQLTFSNFNDAKALNAIQIEFIDLSIDSLTERDVLDSRQLYESHVTNIDDKETVAPLNSARSKNS